MNEPLAYYNEHDPKMAAWLRESIRRDLIMPGDVDERDIRDVIPGELSRYRQCHFFAGVGVWSYALRRAGWPDDRAVWTGSCPCFAAGTLILMERGQIPIEEVAVGDMALTHTGRFRPVLNLMASIKDTIVVRGQGHPGIVTTNEHPFYARGSYRETHRSSPDYNHVLLSDPEWVKAGEMSGRRWACAASVPAAGIPSFGAVTWTGRKPNLPVNPRGVEFARFLGYWAGDGWTTNRSKQPGSVLLCGGHADSDLIASLATDAGLTGSGSVERTGPRFRIGSHLLSRWLDEQFGAGASGKRIPTWLHGMTPGFRAAFLDGLMMADGHETHQPRGGGKVRRLTTVSKTLAVGVALHNNPFCAAGFCAGHWLFVHRLILKIRTEPASHLQLCHRLRVLVNLEIVSVDTRLPRWHRCDRGEISGHRDAGHAQKRLIEKGSAHG